MPIESTIDEAPRDAGNPHVPDWSTPYDLVIAGAGPVGGALALALADTPLRIAVVAPAASRETPSQGGALRPIALAHPSRMLLERLGAFEPAAATPIRSIHVSQRGGFGRTLIEAADHDLPALGHVVDLARIQAPIQAALGDRLVAGELIEWSADGELQRVEIADGGGVMRAFLTRLLVIADGGSAGERAGDIGIVRDYGQVGIVTTVRSSVAHRHVAWERFTASGPLAMLPFGDRYAVVWSVDARDAADIVAARDREFCTRLADAFGGRLGRFDDPAPRIAYPLVLKRWRAAPQAGVIAIGNAAQMLHPVAGQGLNLGLRDAEELARLLRTLEPTELGSEATARRFAGRRALDRGATIAATDTLARLFTSSFAPLALARGLGLAALDLVPFARGALARRMMLGARGLP